MNVSGKGVGVGVGVGVGLGEGVGVGVAEGEVEGMDSRTGGVGPGHPLESKTSAAAAQARIQQRESFPRYIASGATSWRTRQSRLTQYRSR